MRNFASRRSNQAAILAFARQTVEIYYSNPTKVGFLCSYTFYRSGPKAYGE